MRTIQTILPKVFSLIENKTPLIYHPEAMIEEKNVNPLQHQIKMTKTDWVLTYAFSFLILPIRTILLLVIMLVTIIVAKIGSVNMNKEELSNKPLGPFWRKMMRKIVWVLLRCFIRVCGFCITTKGERAPVEEASILMFAPHTSLFDVFAAWYNEVGGIVAQNSVETRNPIVRTFFLGVTLICQSIIVKRDDDNSKRDASNEIFKRTHYEEQCKNNNEIWPQFGLCPEGGISNGKFLMRFKNGAFRPGKPIQPVLIRYPNRLDTVTLDRSNSSLVLWATLCQPFTRMEMEYLPVYYPSIEEQSDATVFASNVNELMAAKLGIPVYEKSAAETLFPKK